MLRKNGDFFLTLTKPQYIDKFYKLDFMCSFSGH